MGTIVIQNHMDVFSFGDLPFNQFQEVEELLVAMPSLTFANHSPFDHIEGSKKTGGSVPLVIMGMPFYLPSPKGQHGLSYIQSLDLALFVN